MKNYKNYYQQQQDSLRNEAIEWQLDFSNHNYSWTELIDYQNYFYTNAKKYGLVKEFIENGII